MTSINVVFCGLLRSPALFLRSLAEMAELQRCGFIKRIVFSTWYGEVTEDSGIYPALKKANVELLESEPPEVTGPGHIWHQMKALAVALKTFSGDERILKTRTDVHIAPEFILKLVQDISLLVKNGDSTCGGFSEKVWVPWFEITKPGYMADECFFGRNIDLCRLVNFDDAYDAAHWGIDAGISHIRRFLHPFRSTYPVLNEYLEYFARTGHNTPLRFNVLEYDLNSRFYWEYLVVYYRIILENFYIETWSHTPHITFQRWSQPTVTILDDTVAGNFHPKASWNPAGGQIYAYNLYWLQSLFSGELAGVDACASQFYQAMHGVQSTSFSAGSPERRSLLEAERLVRESVWGKNTTQHHPILEADGNHLFSNLIDLRLFFENLPEHVIIKLPEHFPNYNDYEDIDIVCREPDLVCAHILSVGKQYINQGFEIKVQQENGHFHVDVYPPGAKRLNFRFDLLASFDVFQKIVVDPLYHIHVLASKRQIIQNGITVCVPALEHELAIRFLEYWEWIDEIPSKIKHLKYIQRTGNLSFMSVVNTHTNIIVAVNKQQEIGFEVRYKPERDSVSEQRMDYFMIWGHGLPFMNQILEIIRGYSDLEIVTIVRKKVIDISQFVQDVYACDTVPFHHLIDKTRYLLTTQPEILFILVNNKNPKECYFGEGAFRHIQSQLIKEVKEEIRNKFNPRSSNGERTENHVVHASDYESQVGHVLHVLCLPPLKYYRNEPHPDIDAPYHLGVFKCCEIIEVDISSLYASIVDQGLLSLSETPHYKYVAGEKADYIRYHQKHLGVRLTDDHFPEAFDRMIATFRYGGTTTSGKQSLIVAQKLLDGTYQILDGVHRAAILAYKGITRVRIAVVSDELQACDRGGGGSMALSQANAASIVCIVFSKDRPLQLDGTLRSLMLHCRDFDCLVIKIIVKASDQAAGQAYTKLEREYSSCSNITLVAENDFRLQVIHILESYSHVLWLVDDNIFVRDFCITDCRQLLESNQDCLGYSLRLGANTTYCYSLDKQQAIPAFHKCAETSFVFNWPSGECDFGYPLEVSSSLYRTEDLLPLLLSAEFHDPNSLERELAARTSAFSSIRPKLLCPISSIAFCNPVNKVQQTAAGNRAGTSLSFSSAALLEAYLDGKRINVAAFDGFVPNACHQEVPLDLVSMVDVVSVSVIIPCYNQAPYLAEAVESVVAQTYADWECLIVNDGSPDNTTEVVRRLIARYPEKRIRLFEKLNGGLADARNFGIKRAKGRYILPLDSDDILHPEILAKTTGFLESHPESAIVYTDLIHFGAVCKQVVAGEYDFEVLKYTNQLNYCSLYRREVWERVGGYNTNMTWGYEDWDFWIGAGERGFYASRLPEALLFYRVKDESMFTKALEHDAELKAQIVMNHPQIYSEQDQMWARDALTKSDSLPLVSVIIPTYDRLDMLKVAIKSVLEQTFQDFEIIVVNDAGLDVLTVTQAFKSAKIRCYSHSLNRGLAAARNTGIRMARGKYIAYLDDDDTFFPEHLQTLVSSLEGLKKGGVAYTDARRAIQQYGADGYRTIRADYPYSHDFDRNALLVDNITPVLCVMHAKECLNLSGMFDESLKRNEDWDLWIRMSRHYDFVHIPKVTCEYTMRLDGSGMVSGTLPSFLVSYRTIYAKYAGMVAEDSQVLNLQKQTLFQLTGDIFSAIAARVAPIVLEAATVEGEKEIQKGLLSAGATRGQIASTIAWQRALCTADKKEALLAEAVALDPCNYSARLALCEELLRTGDFVGAREQLKEIDRANPENLEIISLLEKISVHASSSSGTTAVSIVIPVFNQAALTKNCISVLLTEKREDVEIVVVDNNSTDWAPEYLTSLDDTITLLTNSTNLGFARACNQGAAAATGEYLVLLNNDTVPQPGWLEALLMPVVEGKSEIVGAKLLYPDGTIQHAGVVFDEQGPLHCYKRMPADTAETSQPRYLQAVTAACMLISAELFQQLGGFDEGYRNGFEDIDFCLNAIQQGYRVYYQPTSVLIHHEESSQGRKLHDEENYARFLRRWLGHWRLDYKSPQPLVSVIIPVFNQLAYTKSCLLKLFSTIQHRSELVEVIVINNGSDDGTSDYLISSCSDIRVVNHQVNLGFSKGCNSGAMVAKGQYLVFLNNDTEPCDGWLEALLAVFEQEQRVGVVGSKLLFPDGTIQHAGVAVVRDPYLPAELSPCHIGYQQSDAPEFNLLRECQAVTAACMIMPKTLFDQVGGFDEEYWNGFEDIDLCFKVFQAGYRIMYQPLSVVIHHESKSGKTRKEAELKNLQRLQNCWSGRIRPEFVRISLERVEPLAIG